MIVRVWIDPGCIVCKLCEETAPAVFHVTTTDCVVKEGADLSDAERIKHAAYECPVAVIKVEESAD